MHQWFSKCGPWTSGLSITWKPTRNASAGTRLRPPEPGTLWADPESPSRWFGHTLAFKNHGPVLPCPFEAPGGPQQPHFFYSRMSRLADKGHTLSLEFGKAFDLVLTKSLRTMWENVEKTNEDGSRMRCDNVSSQRHKQDQWPWDSHSLGVLVDTMWQGFCPV